MSQLIATTNVWKALVGRIVLFPTPGVSSLPPANALYRAVWGDDPDNFQKAPNAMSASIAQGKRGGMSVNCMVHPARIDLNLMPAQNHQIDSGLLVIEDTKELHSGFETIIAAVTKGAVSLPIQRTAIFGQFINPASNHTEANRLLTTVMPEPYRPRLTSETDFIFQVNRPYKSRAIDGIAMNSLTKWSVDTIQIVSFSMTVSTPGMSGPTAPRTKAFVAASVSFDINNAPVQPPLSTDHQAALLLEAMNTMKHAQRDAGLNIEGF